MCKAKENKYTVLAFATAKEMHKSLAFAARTLPSKLELGRPFAWQWQNRDFLLLLTGIGPINAALSLGKLLGEGLPLKGVVNIGIAGSFDLNQYPLGKSLLVTEEIWPEFGLCTNNGVFPEELGHALGRSGREQIWNRIEFNSKNNIKALGLSSLDDLPCVRSISVSGVSGTPERASFLYTEYRPQLENMEGFALAWACSNAGLPFVELRTVSNLVGFREKNYWDIKAGLQALGKNCRFLLNIS